MDMKELKNSIKTYLTKEPKTVDEICVGVGTEDDFKVIQALNYLEREGLAKMGQKTGPGCFITTYSLFEKSSEKYVIDKLKKKMISLQNDPEFIESAKDAAIEATKITPEDLYQEFTE